jgi:acyl-coenzyme A synthetase/AMP-(fatty) acid ligase
VFRFTPADRVLWVLPMAYHFAVTLVAYVRAGCHVLLGAESRANALRDAIQRHRATVFYGSPLHIERLAAAAHPSRLASLRLAVSTTAPIRRSVVEQFEARCGLPLTQAYGIIEAGLPCINARQVGDPVDAVGRVVAGYEVAVFGEHGERCATGEPGEIGLRGAGMFSAYYRPWRTFAASCRDGWFLTGDVGWFDANACLHLLGRKKTTIFVAGMKFFPEEVELVLDEHPAVRESRVSAQSHAHLGQIAVADVVLRDDATVGETELRTFLAARLSPHKLPATLRFVTALPKTASGKVVRFTA